MASYELFQLAEKMILPVDEAYQLGRLLAQGLIGRPVAAAGDGGRP